MVEKHMISAEVVTDSVSHEGCRLTTFRLVYPRFIHAHVLTHRAFSRNTSSSRAIPAAKLARLVRENPAMPIFWGENEPGMKAHKEVSSETATAWWLECMEFALEQHKKGLELNLHKEVLNRILEPYAHVVVILSATDFDNFFDVRAFGAGVQSETALLARGMYDALKDSTPKEVGQHGWHLPLVQDAEYTDNALDDAYVSAARCGRVSFLLPELDYATDLQKGRNMAAVKHWSPLEHQAQPYNPKVHWHSSMQRNYTGWVQLRALADSALQNT